MKKIPLIITLIIALPILIVSSVILASPNNACMKFHPINGAMTYMPFGERMTPSYRIMSRLNLSKEQREKIWSIQDKTRPQIRTHRLALLEGRKHLREVIKNNYQQNKIQQLADAQGTTITALIILQAETQHRIQSILTAEQRKQLKDLRGRGETVWQRTEKPWMH